MKIRIGNSQCNCIHIGQQLFPKYSKFTLDKVQYLTQIPGVLHRP